MSNKPNIDELEAREGKLEARVTTLEIRGDTLEKREEELEERTQALERSFTTHSAVSGEQIKTLFKAVNKLFWVTVIFSGILLLTVVYGAVGERGFNHVTTAADMLSR